MPPNFIPAPAFRGALSKENDGPRKTLQTFFTKVPFFFPLH
jgi:hypothetical protein